MVLDSFESCFKENMKDRDVAKNQTFPYLYGKSVLYLFTILYLILYNNLAFFIVPDKGRATN